VSLEQTLATIADIPKYAGVPVVLLSNLTKTGELKGSSNIAHDATVVMSLDVFYPDSKRPLTEKERREAMGQNPRSVAVRIEKNRIFVAGQVVPLDYWAGNHIFRDKGIM
jgi:hypothetical protein